MKRILRLDTDDLIKLVRKYYNGEKITPVFDLIPDEETDERYIEFYMEIEKDAE